MLINIIIRRIYWKSCTLWKILKNRQHYPKYHITSPSWGSDEKFSWRSSAHLISKLFLFTQITLDGQTISCPPPLNLESHVAIFFIGSDPLSPIWKLYENLRNMVWLVFHSSLMYLTILSPLPLLPPQLSWRGRGAPPSPPPPPPPPWSQFPPSQTFTGQWWTLFDQTKDLRKLLLWNKATSWSNTKFWSKLLYEQPLFHGHHLKSVFE